MVTLGFKIAAAFTPERHELTGRVRAVIEAHGELRERDGHKMAACAQAMKEALRARKISEASATVAAELGVLALKAGFARWAGKPVAKPLLPILRRALKELQIAAASLR